MNWLNWVETEWNAIRIQLNWFKLNWIAWNWVETESNWVETELNAIKFNETDEIE